MRHFKISILLAILACMTMLASSRLQRASAAHCYLCGAASSDQLCLIDLSSGQVVELPLDKETGHAVFTFCGDASIIGFDNGSCKVSFPTEPQEMDRSLFCNDCLALLDGVENNGFVLADLNDPKHALLYPCFAEVDYSTEEYDVSIHEIEDHIVMHVTEK